jgi:hypothetical protein
MRSFEVPGLEPAEFVAAIRSKLAARDVDRYVSISLDGDRLAVELRWMGTTRFDYRTSPLGDGFRAELVNRKVSPFHSPFASRFEAYFEEALAKVDAKVT